MAASSTAVLTLANDYQKLKFVEPAMAKTIPMMSAYELNCVVSLRAVHLSAGTLPLIDLPDDFSVKTNMDYRKIAFRELKERKLPFALQRALPNGEIEIWRVSDLNLNSVEYIIEAALRAQ